MRMIDAIELKRSIAASNIIGDGKTLEELIDEQPDAQPQRMRGRWVEIDGWDGDVIYQCSECKEEFALIDGTPQDNLYHYCPNCGSYNGGEQDE